LFLNKKPSFPFRPKLGPTDRPSKMLFLSVTHMEILPTSIETANETGGKQYRWPNSPQKSSMYRLYLQPGEKPKTLRGFGDGLPDLFRPKTSRNNVSEASTRPNHMGQLKVSHLHLGKALPLPPPLPPFSHPVSVSRPPPPPRAPWSEGTSAGGPRGGRSAGGNRGSKRG